VETSRVLSKKNPYRGAMRGIKCETLKKRRVIPDGFQKGESLIYTAGRGQIRSRIGKKYGDKMGGREKRANCNETGKIWKKVMARGSRGSGEFQGKRKRNNPKRNRGDYWGDGPASLKARKPDGSGQQSRKGKKIPRNTTITTEPWRGTSLTKAGRRMPPGV